MLDYDPINDPVGNLSPKGADLLDPVVAAKKAVV